MFHYLRDLLLEEASKQHLSTQEDLNVLHVAWMLALEAPYMRQGNLAVLVEQEGCLALQVGKTVFDAGEMPRSHDAPLWAGKYMHFDQQTVVDVSTLDATTLDKARKLLHCLPSFIFQPSQDDFVQKDTLTLTWATEDTLEQVLQDVIGTSATHLKEYGMKYHEAPNWHIKNWKYLVAHNEHEIAGIMGGEVKDHEMVVAYVSVGPAFQRQGLSKRMLKEWGKQCAKNEKILIRSSASDFTIERGIDKIYDDLFNSMPALHCVTGTYTQKALQDALAVMPYSLLVEEKWSSTFTYNDKEDRLHAQRLRERVARYQEECGTSGAIDEDAHGEMLPKLSTATLTRNSSSMTKPVKKMTT